MIAFTASVRRRPWIVAGCALGFTLLAVAAAVDGGSLLLEWDEPIQRFVEENLRAGWLTPLVRFVTFFGSTIPVLVGAAVLAVLTWRRWPALAATLVVAAIVEHWVTSVLKELIERPRPDLDPIYAAPGFSMPSGHAFGSVVLFGLVPLAVARLTEDRRWQRLAVAGSIAAVAVIGFSRLYLGVHWFTDVVGAVLVGVVYLAAVWAVMTRVWPESTEHPPIQ